MKLIFDKSGKYMNDYRVMEVTEQHVEAKTVFNVSEGNASHYVKAKLAHVYDEAEDTGTDIDKMNVKQHTVSSKKAIHLLLEFCKIIHKIRPGIAIIPNVLCCNPG